MKTEWKPNQRTVLTRQRCHDADVLFCVRLVSKVLNLECSSEYAPISSSAEDGGVKEFANASTSSINLTRGIPRSFSPSVMESKLISSTAIAPLSPEVVLERSSVDIVAVDDGWLSGFVKRVWSMEYAVPYCRMKRTRCVFQTLWRA